MDQNKKTPQVRFKGYTDTWEQRKLIDEVASIDTGKSRFVSCDSGEYEILGSTSVIGYDNSYDYEGDFLLTARVGANAGELYRHSGKVKISDNTVFIQGNYLDFIYYALLNFDIKQLSFGTGQPLVKASELKGQNIRMPVSMKERKYIGNYFKAWDSLITLHQSKYDKLLNLKKAMLEKMFPQNGSLYPEIRFKGFTDAWEQCKLSDKFSDFIVPMRDKPKKFCGQIPWTRIEDIEGKYLNGTLSGQYVSHETIKNMNLKIIPKNSLIVSSSATFGVVAIVTKDLITNQTFIGLVPNDKDTLDFWYIFFQSNDVRRYMKLESAGSTIFYIARESFEKMPIKIPSKVEMKKIGQYFSQLDNLITLHQCKLEKLQNIKKACLEKMFV